MKVELVSPSYDQPFGLPRYRFSLAACLSEAGIDYSLAVPSMPSVIARLQPFAARNGLDLSTFLTAYPVSISLSRDTVKHFTSETLASFLGLRRAHQALVTAHDARPDWLVYGLYRGYRRTLYRLFHNLAMKGLRRADAVITDTHYVMEDLVGRQGCQRDRLRVIPLGVDPELFRSVSVPDRFRQRYRLGDDLRCILHVGTDAPRKNIIGLVRAVARVRVRFPNVLLVRAGPASSWPLQAQKVQRTIEELELDNHVLFLPNLPDEDLAMLYNVADAVVYPSLHEGFGLPVLEAMACGTPVVTSTVSCLPEVSGGCAVLVDPTDVEGLAAAMERVLTDADLAADLRQRGLARAAQFTWERTARETVAVYYEIMSQRPQARSDE